MDDTDEVSLRMGRSQDGGGKGRVYSMEQQVRGATHFAPMTTAEVIQRRIRLTTLPFVTSLPPSTQHARTPRPIPPARQGGKCAGNLNVTTRFSHTSSLLLPSAVSPGTHCPPPISLTVGPAPNRLQPPPRPASCSSPPKTTACPIVAADARFSCRRGPRTRCTRHLRGVRRARVRKRMVRSRAHHGARMLREVDFCGSAACAHRKPPTEPPEPPPPLAQFAERLAYRHRGLWRRNKAPEARSLAAL